MRKKILIAMAILLAAGAVTIGIMLATTPVKSTYYQVGPTHLIGESPSPSPQCSPGQADIPGVNC
jgi:hypothetical protein